MKWLRRISMALWGIGMPVATILVMAKVSQAQSASELDLILSKAVEGLLEFFKFLLQIFQAL